MGKRKRRCVNPEVPVSGHLPNSSRRGSLSERKSCNEVESNAIAPPSSSVEFTDDPVNAPGSSHLLVKHKHLSRSTLVRNPRYSYRKFSLRKSSCNAGASTSYGEENALFDASHVSRLQREIGGEASHKPERNMSSLLSINVVSPDSWRLLCGICEKRLTKSRTKLGNSVSPCEPSVVAVLVCGHPYHADCLEQKTSQEERADPSCPLCVNSTS